MDSTGLAGAALEAPASSIVILSVLMARRENGDNVMQAYGSDGSRLVTVSGWPLSGMFGRKRTGLRPNQATGSRARDVAYFYP
jgi:hypothetical protein